MPRRSRCRSTSAPTPASHRLRRGWTGRPSSAVTVIHGVSNPNYQAPSSNALPNTPDSKAVTASWSLEAGSALGFGAWNLGIDTLVLTRTVH
jgi:hypothetical protein